MPSSRKPTADYIKELQKQVEQDYAERNDSIEHLRLRRFQKVAPKIPEEFRKTAAEFRSPLVADFIRKAKAIASDKMPIPTVTPVGDPPGPEAQKVASLKEEWLTAAYTRMEEDEPAFEQFWDAVVADKSGVIKVLGERHRWGIDPGDDDAASERYREHKRQVFPFHWEHVDTTTYHPVYDEDGLAEVLEITKRKTLPVALKWGLVPIGNGKLKMGRRIGQVTVQDYPPNITFTEYWSRTHFAYLVDDILVKVEGHGWGRPPYYEATSSRTSSKDPAEQHQSLAEPLAQLQDAIDNMETVAANRSYLTGFPYTTLDPISEEFFGTENMPKEIRLRHDQVNFVAGAKFRYLEPPPVSEDVKQMQTFLLGMADRLSLAPILSGIMAADASGVTTTTMIAVAKAIFGPGLRDVARVFDKIAADIFRYIDTQVREPVPVLLLSKARQKWLELGPKQIDGYYRVHHSNDPVIAAEQRLDYITSADAAARDLVDDAYVLEKLGIHDPEQMLRRVKIQKLTQMPQYLNLMMQAVIEALRPGEAAAPMGTSAVPPIGPGGPGVPQVAGVQQPIMPGGPMAAREETM